MIKVEVKEDGTLIACKSVVSDSVNFEKIKFDFPEKWGGYIKTAVFRHGEDKLSVILDAQNDLCYDCYACYVPHEVIKYPKFTVSVFGIMGNSRITSKEAAISVIQSGYGEGDKPSKPTTSEYEQLINLAHKTEQTAKSTKKYVDDTLNELATKHYVDNLIEKLKKSIVALGGTVED